MLCYSYFGNFNLIYIYIYIYICVCVCVCVCVCSGFHLTRLTRPHTIIPNNNPLSFTLSLSLSHTHTHIYAHTHTHTHTHTHINGCKQFQQFLLYFSIVSIFSFSFVVCLIIVACKTSWNLRSPKNFHGIKYITIIMSCCWHGYPWPSLATSPYRSSP